MSETTPENRHLDVRVVHRYLRKGILDEKDYQQLIKKLPDLADQAIPVESEFQEEMLDED
jgi:hypothetical protein